MTLSVNVLKKLQKTGYVQLNDVFSRDFCEQTIKQFNLEQATVKNLLVDQLLCENRIWRAEDISENVKSILVSEFVMDISRQLEQKAEFAIFNHVWSGDGPGSGGGWHRDTRFGPQYKIIIYLTDCHLGNGEYWYIPGSHGVFSIFSLLRITELFRKPRYDRVPFLLDYFARKIPGKAGDVIITNTVGLHRGSKVLRGERFAVTIYFKNGVSKID